MRKWQIPIENIGLGGYAPIYWKNPYGSFGNRNMSISHTNTDMIDPSLITQGAGLATIDTVSDLIRGIHPTVLQANITYGIGSDGIYRIKSTATDLIATVSSATGEDVALYAGHAKFSFGTDIVDYDLASTWDKDWWTAVAGGAALTSGKPHCMEVAGTSGVLYVANGQYVAQWNGTTATDDAFDTQDSDSVICSIKWNQNRLWIAANKPDVAGRKEGSIYVWDGTSTSWDKQIKIKGEIGTLWVKNGVTYVIYQKNLSQGVCTLGYIDGNQVKDLGNYLGSLPEYYQITEYEDFITWASGTKVFAFGSGDEKLNGRLFQLSTCGTGGLANPFGKTITASSTKVEQYSGYSVISDWRSIQYEVQGENGESMLDEIRFNIEKMETGARVDYTLRNNRGTAIATGTLSFANNSIYTHIRKKLRCKADNFRVEFDWANGSTTNPVKIKSILIKGHTL